MIVDILILIVGFVALIKGADIFVDGSSSLAKHYKVSGLIIGLTIVAFGTSAPELAVSTTAALTGSNEIALSNVLGSNIFNLLVVLGVCACISPLTSDKDIIRRDFPISMVCAIFIAIVAFVGIWRNDLGSLTSIEMSSVVADLSRPIAIGMLLVFIAYIVYLIMDARKNPEEDDNIKSRKLSLCALLIVAGLALVIGGGQAVVYAAKRIAAGLGMSETLIGLTVVAVGTSLPELVTSIVAALKKQTGLAVGNVIGSNIFNILLILSVSSAIHPIGINFASLTDALILFVVSGISLVFVITGKRINRAEGITMVLMYVAYMVFAFFR